MSHGPDVREACRLVSALPPPPLHLPVPLRTYTKHITAEPPTHDCQDVHGAQLVEGTKNTLSAEALAIVIGRF